MVAANDISLQVSLSYSLPWPEITDIIYSTSLPMHDITFNYRRGQPRTHDFCACGS